MMKPSFSFLYRVLCLCFLSWLSVSSSAECYLGRFTQSLEKPLDISSDYEEHHVMLERNAGGKGINHFFKFLDINLADIELGAFSFKTTDEGLITKFFFDLREKKKIRAKIQSGGFYTFEFSWRVDKNNHVYDIWYRFDEGEKKSINLDNPVDTKPINIKYKSI